MPANEQIIPIIHSASSTPMQLFRDTQSPLKAQHSEFVLPEFGQSVHSQLQDRFILEQNGRLMPPPTKNNTTPRMQTHASDSPHTFLGYSCIFIELNNLLSQLYLVDGISEMMIYIQSVISCPTIRTTLIILVAIKSCTIYSLIEVVYCSFGQLNHPSQSQIDFLIIMIEDHEGLQDKSPISKSGLKHVNKDEEFIKMPPIHSACIKLPFKVDSMPLATSPKKFVALTTIAGFQHVIHFDHHGKTLGTLKLPSQSSPKLTIYDKKTIALLYHTSQKYVISLWSLDSYASRKYSINYHAEQYRLYTFGWTGLLCVVLYLQKSLKIIYLDRQLKLVREYEHLQKEATKMSCRKLAEFSMICFIYYPQKQNCAISFTTFSLTSDLKIVTKKYCLRLKQKLPELHYDWQYRKLTDIGMLNTQAFYLQFATLVDEKQLILSYRQVDSEKNLLNHLQYHLNLIWHVEKELLQKINCSRINARQAHRIQFVDTLRQLKIDANEGKTAEKRFGQSLHLTGYHIDYFKYKQNVPIYFFDLFTRRTVGVWPENRFMTSNFNFQSHFTNMASYSRMDYFHSVFLFCIWRLPQFMSFSMPCYSTFMLQNLIDQCDHDLLSLVSQMLNPQGETRFIQFEFPSSNQPQLSPV